MAVPYIILHVCTKLHLLGRVFLMFLSSRYKCERIAQIDKHLKSLHNSKETLSLAIPIGSKATRFYKTAIFQAHLHV